MSDGSPSVAIAVATHDRNGPLAVLLRALVAVADHTLPEAKVGVVVIDDNPDGRARTVCDEFEGCYPLGLRYVHVGAQNISVARNAALTNGMDLADFVVLTDDDCDPAPTWLSALLAMQAATDADIVTGPFQLRASPGAPPWYEAQGFVGASQLYEDGSEPPHGCTANALLRTRFLVEHPDVRFLSHYGKTGGEDMVFFHTAAEAGAVHRYALDAMMYEDIPVARTSFRFTLTKNFWFGNNMAVINRTTREAPRLRLVVRGVRWVVEAAARPARRVVAGDPPHLRRALYDAMIGFGLVAGAFGFTARHH